MRVDILRPLTLVALLAPALLACNESSPDPLALQIRTEGELITKDIITRHIAPEQVDPQLVSSLRPEILVIRQSQDDSGLPMALSAALPKLNHLPDGSYLEQKNADAAFRSCIGEVRRATKLTPSRLNILDDEEIASVIQRIVEGGVKIAYREGSPQTCSPSVS